jgi:hypothetical protein
VRANHSALSNQLCELDLIYFDTLLVEVPWSVDMCATVLTAVDFSTAVEVVCHLSCGATSIHAQFEGDASLPHDTGFFKVIA